MKTALLQTLNTPPNKVLEIEEVYGVENETEEREIEGVDSENEGMELDNYLLDNKVLPPEQKCYCLRKPINVNYSYKRSTLRSMGWNNLIIGSNELHSIAKSYVNVVNNIATFVEPNTPTNIIKNDMILKQYSIKRHSRYLVRRVRLHYEKNYRSFMIEGWSNRRNPKTSVMNSKEGS